ncbi:MAG: energy transducer TonB [candidate division KSB1 bacterium]|nr:energy transducer TonB [candidate division KSB1 bacterium]
MLSRINPQVNLRWKYRKVMEVSLVLALLLMTATLQAFKRFEGKKQELKRPDIKIEVEEIPQTEQERAAPPPARPAVPIESEDEDIPEDETIATTELDLTQLPPPPEKPPEEQTDEEVTPIFVAYDSPPEPIGGFEAIQRNLVYPEIARKAGVEGRVIVHVLVDERGNVVETKILKSLGNNGCDEAAVAAIKSVKWKPAMQRDRPVKVWVAIPVIFKLKD